MTILRIALTFPFLCLTLLASSSLAQVTPTPTPALQDISEFDKILSEIDAQEDSSLRVSVDEDKSKSTANQKSLILRVERKADSNKGLTKKVLLNLNITDLQAEEQLNSILKGIVSGSWCGSIPNVSMSLVGTTPFWRIDQTYTYAGQGYRIKVPYGFQFDRASIPLFFQLLITKDHLGNVAPLIHDYLYRYGGALPADAVDPSNTRFSRLQADELFKRIMGQCGVKRWRQKAAYMAVRLGGCPAWKGPNCD